MSESIDFDLTEYVAQCLTANLSNHTLRQRIQSDIQSTKEQIRERLVTFGIDFDRLANNYNSVFELNTELKSSEKELNEFIESDLITRIGELREVCNRSDERIARSEQISDFIGKFEQIKDEMSSLDQSFAVNDYDSSVQHMTNASHLYRQLISAIKDNHDLKPISKGLKTYLDSLNVDLTLKREEMFYKTKQIFNANVKTFRDEFNNENVFEFNLIKNLKTSEYHNFVKTFVGIEEKSFFLKDLVKKLNLFFIKPILSQEITELELENNRIVAKFSKNSSLSPISILKEFFCDLYKLITNDNQMEISLQLVRCLGDIWTEDVFNQILKYYLNPLMPKNELEIKSFLSVIDSAEDLRQYLIEICFIDETQNSPFIEFAININSHFCCRLCTDFLITGKTIICRDLHQTVQIGNEGPNDDNLKIGSCRVSQSMIDLKQLVQQIIDLSDRCSPDCAKALVETIGNLCELYIDISPIYHRKMITEFPQQNAIFHNNCMYFGNFIEVFVRNHKSLAVLKSFVSIVKQLGSQLFLRQMQSQEKLLLDLVQNQQFNHCINELATEDSKSSYGDQLDKELRHVLRQCLVHLNFLRNALIDVLPQKVYQKAIGTIINSLFSELINKIIVQNDISSSGASRLTTEIEFLLKEVKDFLKEENPMRFVQKWSKLSELNFILNASLLDIVDRWSEGRGILAADFTAQEVKQLIRALFQNTERRAQALNKIISY